LQRSYGRSFGARHEHFIWHRLFTSRVLGLHLRGDGFDLALHIDADFRQARGAVGFAAKHQHRAGVGGARQAPAAREAGYRN